MSDKRDSIDRRNFLKTLGAAGLASALVSGEGMAGEQTQKPKFPQVPKRKLGKTGLKVSCLALGTNRLDNQVVLGNTLKWGVSYWDTANVYLEGNSELNIGRYLAKNPDVRKKLFLATKAKGATTAEGMEQLLELSLGRMKTKYVDLHCFHDLRDPALLNNEIKQWAESAKKRKLIRFFGLSTHRNMPEVLAAVAKLGWIDVVVTVYNFRLMQDKKLSAAIDACHKAGIGLVAIKTQGLGQKIETEEDKKLAGHFLQRGFTEGQAKIKAVLQDKRITAACVGMQNLSVLTENVAAALDKTKLTQSDMAALTQYARATCSGYCAGCACICDVAVPDVLRPGRISDIMRYLMYYNSYGDQAEARGLFARIPVGVRNKLLSTDYGLAEARCPQHLPIAKLVAEAVSKLA